MRKLLFCLALTVALAAPLAARADMIIEGSLGQGYRVKPDHGMVPTSVMLAPGLTLLSMLRFQVGLEGALPDVENSKFDIHVRPMVTLSPPILPVYGRLIFAFTNLLDSDARGIAYGGALGLEFAVPVVGIGIFGEAAFLPQKANDVVSYIIEARAGVSFKF